MSRIEEGGSYFYSDFLRASGQFIRTFGGTKDVYLTVYTTQTGVIYAPSFVSPFVLNNSGVANASGLNPFGSHTVGQGLVWGTGNIAPSGMEFRVQRDAVRTFGLKGPLQLVGFGYDIFGYPAPNADASWHISGYRSVNGPSAGFAALIPPGTSAEVSGQMAMAGANVPSTGWKAGPVDLRWDVLRGVWTAPQSVYSARIYSSDISGSINSTAYAYSKDIRYTVQVFDGPANQLTITGVSQFGIRPEDNTYQVKPLVSGAACLLMHVWENGRPSYGVLGFESPKLEECDNTTRNTDIVYRSSVQAASGIDYENLYENQFLRGSASGGFGNVWLVAGTGISIQHAPTGTIIGFNSGVAFVSAGVNTNITQLQGLTTPLTIAQGGTGASGKVWVDLTTSQSISGIKIWQSQARFDSGSLTNPAITVGGNTSAGFSYSASSGLTASIYGTGVWNANTTGTFLSHEVKITNVSSIFNPSLTVYPQPLGSPTVLRVLNNAGSGAIDLTSSGVTFFRTSGSIGVMAPNGITESYAVILPTGGQLVTKDYVDALIAASGGGGGSGYTFDQIASIQSYIGDFA